MKIVIIEDEKYTAKDLAHTIRIVEPDAEIVSILYSVEDALIYFEMNPEVDLIFSDIELGDGLSFDIFRKVEIQAPVIFCTAYQQYTLEAFQTLGIDYTLKPFSKQSIGKALQKYKVLKNKFVKPVHHPETLYSHLKNVQLYKPSVLAHQGDKIIPVNESEIALFYIENDCTYAYTFQQKKVLINQRLDKLEDKFTNFFRANRQFLVNRKAVKDASQYFNRKMVVNLSINFPEKIIIGKLKTTEFINWLESNG